MCFLECCANEFKREGLHVGAKEEFCVNLCCVSHKLLFYWTNGCEHKSLKLSVWHLFLLIFLFGNVKNLEVIKYRRLVMPCAYLPPPFVFLVILMDEQFGLICFRCFSTLMIFFNDLIKISYFSKSF